jgi:hypothetical protein
MTTKVEVWAKRPRIRVRGRLPDRASGPSEDVTPALEPDSFHFLRESRALNPF